MLDVGNEVSGVGNEELDAGNEVSGVCVVKRLEEN